MMNINLVESFDFNNLNNLNKLNNNNIIRNNDTNNINT